MTNKIELKYVDEDTQLIVNDEYITTIRGTMKLSNVPESSNSIRFENEHGYVWVIMGSKKKGN